MKDQDFPIISVPKFNVWCHRRPLVCADKGMRDRATGFFRRSDLTPYEQSAFFLHELTGCEGMEFVAFSNAKLKRHVILSNEVILMPCFVSDVAGQNSKTQLVQLSMKMERQGRLIYDGWIPILRWDEESVRRAVRNVDEALSAFCLRGRTYFEWEPKIHLSINIIQK